MPELRKDPIVDRWVIISEERAHRPGDFPSPTQKQQISFCPFCPGNENKTPEGILALPQNIGRNAPGWSLRVVANKFPALEIECDVNRIGEGMFDKMGGFGAHEVIIEHPDHALSLEEASAGAIAECLWAFQQRILDLKKDSRFRYILIFKNHGEAAGATLEHSHSQLIALPIIPEMVLEEIQAARRHWEYKERCIFCDLIAQERGNGSRVVLENQNFIAICPYAPRFPFETWILPKYHQARYEKDTSVNFAQAAALLKEILLRIRQALNIPPYNLVFHTSPLNGEHDNIYHWHIEVMPKLTKMAGFEQGTGFYINPTPPETAAEILRSVQINP